MSATRITVRAHLRDYLESVGEAMRESDPTAIVNRIIEDHRAFIQGVTQPTKTAKLFQDKAVDVVDEDDTTPREVDLGDFEL
ncbi:hypothetical protein CKA32_007003 [Geitlerinema sp. FC II]|nr:hypothetical protein CKA32_007003 [Geitlerinema sp. FC II]